MKTFIFIIIILILTLPISMILGFIINLFQKKSKQEVDPEYEERMESMMNDGCQTSILLLISGFISAIISTYFYLNWN